ncbi:glycosyltransferase family 2 protein [Thiopseudomonas alkaliphila]|uniref:glycosyltransferase family 2 protein n=1 Tax=Thiopseudomonas alkaliphila TaxID=1697053 RepID=UPI003570F163
MSSIDPLVSIIVPFYNPGEYFQELIESLKRQSYSNIQIILVNDGSDNKSSQQALAFAAEDSRVVLVEKENGGVASARQAGLEVSTGDYIIHADADDFVPRTAIFKLVTKALLDNADVVVGGYRVSYSSKEIDVFAEDVSYCEFVKGLIDGRFHGSLSNKLIRAELCKVVSFEVGLNYMEDKLYLARVLRPAKREISYLNEVVYIYRQNALSVTYNLSSVSIQSSIKVVEHIVDEYADCFNDSFLELMLNKQRAFAIFQMAKNSINVYEASDWRLVLDTKIPAKYRFAVILVRFRILWPFQLIKYFKARKLL